MLGWNLKVWKYFLNATILPSDGHKIEVSVYEAINEVAGSNTLLIFCDKLLSYISCYRQNWSFFQNNSFWGFRLAMRCLYLIDVQ